MSEIIIPWYVRRKLEREKHQEEERLRSLERCPSCKSINFVSQCIGVMPIKIDGVWHDHDDANQKTCADCKHSWQYGPCPICGLNWLVEKGINRV